MARIRFAIGASYLFEVFSGVFPQPNMRKCWVTVGVGLWTHFTADEPRQFILPTLPQRRITYVPEKLPSKYGVHSEEYVPIRTNYYLKQALERIPNLRAEQSDGITVFRISTMTSLMLHRCRTDSISLQSRHDSHRTFQQFFPISLQRDVIIFHRSGEIRNRPRKIPNQVISQAETESTPVHIFGPKANAKNDLTLLLAKELRSSAIKQDSVMFLSTVLREENALDLEVLTNNLVFIQTYFQTVSETITRLEKSQQEMPEALKLIEEMTQRINETPSTPVTERVKQKWKSILCTNDGYGTLCNINSKLVDIESTENKGLSLRDCNDVRFFRFAPITSYDVERSFSQYKLCLADNRKRFTFETLKMCLVVHWNSVL
ncbi:hypothetical protein ANN_06956 [Periplaneta americana]|uniref:DUF659 domain-containing protein n=1 Tax=Periplaneta americana TaxID=6978 RepID=A0ABQ8THJ8_PERAM|nr:hypothetical protein ANN_06956 [Periplaneta americana]